MKRRLSEIHPFLYHARIWQKRAFRRIADLPRVGRFSSEIDIDQLPFTCKKHQSLLRRRLGNSDPQLQENKIENLRIACPRIDGILIKPGQTFSFWRQLGEATADKGYHEGMQLSRGEVVRGVGGGLCQLANLLYWMVLHTPLISSASKSGSKSRSGLSFIKTFGTFTNYTLWPKSSIRI